MADVDWGVSIAAELQIGKVERARRRLWTRDFSFAVLACLLYSSRRVDFTGGRRSKQSNVMSDEVEMGARGDGSRRRICMCPRVQSPVSAPAFRLEQTHLRAKSSRGPSALAFAAN